MMKADFFYQSVPGRFVLKIIQKTGVFRLAAWFLHTKASRRMIPGFVRRNGIDMTPWEGQSFASYADFFSRTEARSLPESRDGELTAPCDSLLSLFPVTEDMTLPMKGSSYRLRDLIPGEALSASFSGGLCLVFRLEATDYHHFISFDDAVLKETGFIEGQLHSVQPIALAAYPVFRLNRRWWTLLHTAHFGPAVQIEVGAMVVGGVQFSENTGRLSRGEEMGHFTLAGSTILLFLTKTIKDRLVLYPSLEKASAGLEEVPVRMGEPLGKLS